MVSSLKLSFSFDPKSLQADLAQITADEWSRHFNTGYFEGEWLGIALRSIGGVASQLYSDPATHEPFADTPVLDRCPHVSVLLKTFHCPLRSVRFLKLAPGAIIREHRDYDLGFEYGQVRLHIPVATNDDVDFFLDAHRVVMQPGECWYLDFGLPHWVENRGLSDRVHLVIDCELNDWLRQLLPSADAQPDSDGTPVYESSPPELERFRQAVLNDLDLQTRFRQTADRESFIRLVLGIAHERGYKFSAINVEDALRAGQGAWLQRWID